MRTGVKVKSEAIAEFETGLGRFAQVSVERVKTAEIAIRKTTQQLEDRRGELRRELLRLQDEIANADDEEDTNQARQRYAETEEALSNVKKWQRTVDDAVSVYERESAKFQDLTTGTTVEARTFLRLVLNDLASYFALQHAGVGAGGGARADGVVVGEITRPTSRATFDPTVFSLPPGYVWVSITEIDTLHELKGASTKDSFTKVPFDEMRRGFDLLRTEILPVLNKSSDPGDKEIFAHRDAATGAPFEKGLLRIYEAFYGDGHIHLERGQNDQLFSISNGRHRIRVAMEAGWTAVPVTRNDRRDE